MQDMNSGPATVTPLNAGRYQIEDLQIDTRVRQVTRDGVELGITGLTFDLLWALVRVAPHLVSFDALMEQVWPGLVVGPETVTQRVKLLRQALGDRAENPRYVLAVRGHGYRMPAAALAPAVALGTDVAGVPQSIRRRVPHVWWAPVAVVLVLAAGGGWWISKRQPLQPPSHVLNGAAALPSGSVAVMPFVNLTGDPGKDYFGDGMAEEIINALGQVQGLKVSARISSFAYKGRNLDIRQIAQDLGVSTVLEGSVRSAGSRIRITAQLIDARSGYQVWSRSYDRDYGDIFKLQDDLAQAILKALQVNLNGAAPASVALAPPTQNIEAYDLYLQGEAGMLVGDHGLARYQRALALDPKFARAYVGVGLAKFLLGISTGPSIEDLAEATRFANQALRLDPGLASAHSLLANVDFTQGRWLEAEGELREAMRLGPVGGIEHFSHGLNFLFTGHRREALNELKIAVDLNPTHLTGIGFRSVAYSLRGRDAEALASARLGAHLGDTSSALPYVSAMAALRAGHYAEAATFARGIQDPTLPDQARTAEVTRLVFAALADPAGKPAAMAARLRLYPKMLADAGRRAANSDITSCLQSSYTYALLGELDTVFDLAGQCLDGAAPGAINSVSYILLWQPEARSLRQDPRFMVLATRLGFMAYWRQYGPPDDCDLDDGKLLCH